MRGVGEKLALLAPGLLHRPRGPPGEEDGNAQQQGQCACGDDQIAAHHLPQDGLFHGHVHKGQTGVKTPILPQIAQMIILNHAFVLRLVQTVLQNGGQSFAVVQVGIGSTGDVRQIAAGVGIDIDGKIGEQDHVMIPNGDLSAGKPAGPERTLILSHLVEQLPAQVPHILADGEEHGGKDHRQDGSD